MRTAPKCRLPSALERNRTSSRRAATCCCASTAAAKVRCRPLCSSQPPLLTAAAGHSVWMCPEPRAGDGFNFAVCFICKQQGHLSRQCTQNEHGIYPRGGQCVYCQGKDHLAKDCPTRAHMPKHGADATHENRSFARFCLSILVVIFDWMWGVQVGQAAV